MIPNLTSLSTTADLHVHSTFSHDGSSTIEENVAVAARRGITLLCLVDHVDVSTRWVPAFGQAVAAIDRPEGMSVHCGVEADVLDLDGTVDLPRSLPGIDAVLIAEHRVPRPRGPRAPEEVRAELETGELMPGEVVAGLVEATVNAMRCHPFVIVAHPFGVLRRLGLTEESVPDQLVRRVGQAAAAAGAAVEVNERWGCPSRRVARLLHEAGATLVLSSGAHHASRVGVHRWADRVAAEITGVVDAA